MILRLLLLSLLFLAACGRPLTPNERAFAASLMGDELAMSRVRLVKGAPVGAVTFHRKPRPRVTCRELILPPSMRRSEISSLASAAEISPSTRLV